MDSTASSSVSKMSKRLHMPTIFKVCTTILDGCTSLIEPPPAFAEVSERTSTPMPLESMSGTSARFNTIDVSLLRISSSSRALNSSTLWPNLRLPRSLMTGTSDCLRTLISKGSPGEPGAERQRTVITLTLFHRFVKVQSRHVMGMHWNLQVHRLPLCAIPAERVCSGN
jgi:hypothetical protein